jgi:hypothetical protein
MAGGCEIVEHHEEHNRTGDVDEGVDAVDPVENSWSCEEPFLEINLPEDMKTLFEVDNL